MTFHQVTNEPIYQVRVKIGGLTNLEDALVAAEAGADLLGFIFYEKSPRCVDPGTVAKIVSALRSDTRFTSQAAPRCVGVFVNTAPEQIAETLTRCGLDLAQLHGEEDTGALAALAGRAFKAVRPQTAAEAQAAAQQFAVHAPADGPDLLLDAWHPALRGGTGETGDWHVAAGIARQNRVLLAGGLTPDNAAAAIAQVAPWGVDVASGVEASPGRKDHRRVREFVKAVRECQ